MMLRKPDNVLHFRMSMFESIGPEQCPAPLPFGAIAQAVDLTRRMGRVLFLGVIRG